MAPFTFFFACLDEGTRNTQSESTASSSTSISTVDKDTDSRHESPTMLDEVKMDKSAKEECSAPAENRDKNSTNLSQRKEEFAVPVALSLPRRKLTVQNKIPVEGLLVAKETESKEQTENFELEDNESQLRRKRVKPDLAVDAQQELNEKTEENVSLLFT